MKLMLGRTQKEEGRQGRRRRKKKKKKKKERKNNNNTMRKRGVGSGRWELNLKKGEAGTGDLEET